MSKATQFRHETDGLGLSKNVFLVGGRWAAYRRKCNLGMGVPW